MQNEGNNEKSLHIHLMEYHKGVKLLYKEHLILQSNVHNVPIQFSLSRVSELCDPVDHTVHGTFRQSTGW